MKRGDKVFLDTNVVLDHLADRQPFAEAAHRLFALAETGQISLCVSALAFSNLSYLPGRLVGRERTLALLRLLGRLTRVTITGEAEVRAALAGEHPDFEDALQWQSARPKEV
jgi:predicted nucleic acid-binding protein